MERCECKSHARGLVKCDAHLMDEMRALGFDPVSCGYKHNGRQNTRIVSVRCPDCGDVRGVLPSNARIKMGLKCRPCSYKGRRPMSYKDRECNCGEVFTPRSSVEVECERCHVQRFRDLGHDALRTTHHDGTRWVVCRCSICGVEKEARPDDLQRERVHRPWRCHPCSVRHSWIARRLTREKTSA
jgi:ribosomal protein S27E